MPGVRQPQLPGVPAGTCMLMPGAQLHGVKVRQAINAHCCSGVNGDGPAHGTAGEPQDGPGSACATPAPENPHTEEPIVNANAASAETRLARRRMYPLMFVYLPTSEMLRPDTDRQDGFAQVR